MLGKKKMIKNKLEILFNQSHNTCPRNKRTSHLKELPIEPTSPPGTLRSRDSVLETGLVVQHTVTQYDSSCSDAEGRGPG